MSFLSLILIAFSMSADAFAVAISKGAVLRRPRLSEALRVGAIFGFIEMLTPIIGWWLGVWASDYVNTFDHWIAFSILAILGGRMMLQSLKPAEDKAKPRRHKLVALVIAGIGSSIDAMAVGATFAFIDVDIMLAAVLIGLATFIMATIGVMIGRFAGERLGRRAEFIGGCILLVIGSLILVEHLHIM